jgi:hypothetical protein
MVETETTFKYNILTRHDELFPLQYGVIIYDILSKSVSAHCSYNNYSSIITVLQFRRAPYNYQSKQWQIKQGNGIL